MSVSVPVSQLSEVPHMAPVRRAQSVPVQFRPQWGAALVSTVAFVVVLAALVFGWGIDQVLVLVDHPARLAVLVAMALFYALSVAQSITSLGATNRVGPFRVTWFRVFMAGSLAPVLSSAFLDGRVLFYLPGEDLTRYIGAGLFVVGTMFAFWAGRRGHNRGFARNSGWMLMLVGLPLAFLSQIGLFGGLCGGALILFRACRERKTAACGR